MEYTHKDYWRTTSNPSSMVAGDVIDLGYIVEVYMANMYWARPKSMGITVFATLDKAIKAAQDHDAAVVARKAETNEGGKRERYRIRREVREYRSSVEYEVVVDVVYEFAERLGAIGQPRQMPNPH